MHIKVKENFYCVCDSPSRIQIFYAVSPLSEFELSFFAFVPRVGKFRLDYRFVSCRGKRSRAQRSSSSGCKKDIRTFVEIARAAADVIASLSARTRPTKMTSNEMAKMARLFSASDMSAAIRLPFSHRRTRRGGFSVTQRDGDREISSIG